MHRHAEVAPALAFAYGNAECRRSSRRFNAGMIGINLDGGSTPLLIARWRQERKPGWTLVIHLAGVEFISSSGIGNVSSRSSCSPGASAVVAGISTSISHRTGFAW